MSRITLRGAAATLRGEGAGALMARGAGGAFVVNLASAGVGFVAQVLLANLMGTAQYGLYVYVVSWLTVVQLLAVFGYNKTVLRYLAAYRKQGEWARFRGLLVHAHGLPLLWGSVLGAVMAGLAQWAWPESPYRPVFLWGALVLPLMAVGTVRQAALQALKWVSAALIPEQLVRPVVLVALVYGAYRVSGGLVSGATAMALNNLAFLAAVGLGFAMLYRALPAEGRRGPRDYARADWSAMARPLLLVAAMHIAVRKGDILILGAMAGEEAVGVYGAATRITDLVVFGLAAVNAIASPMLSEAFAAGDRDQFQRITTYAAWGIAVLCVPLVLALWAFGGWVMGLFGEGFAEGHLALAILVAGQLVNALTGPVTATLTMTGYQRQTAWIMGGVLVLSVGLNVALIPRYGAVGAAMATAIATAVNNLAMTAATVRLLGVNPTVFRRINRTRT